MMAEFKELFNQSGIAKRLVVSFPNLSVTLRNEDIVSESMEISESLCSEPELRFGSCEASVFKLRIIGNVIPLIGETFTVEMYVGDITEPYSIGTYKVASDKPTADRRFRDIVAYDAMYDVINADVAEWYNSVLPNKNSTTTLRAFRDSFMEHFGIEQEEITLPNDEIVVERTIEPEAISGKDVLSAICEINGCFGHIGRNGKMRYVYISEFVDGLYPMDELYPAEDLFPNDDSAERLSQQNYNSCKYEDFTTKKIGKLQIRQEENDVGCIIGEGENCYIIEGNFLVYGKDTAGLQAIGQKLFDIISGLWYRPATVNAIGNPCLEVGAGIRVNTQYAMIETYILERKLKGIHALSDSYEAGGKETYSEEVNSVQKSIVQLKGKMNILTRTAEETKSELIELESNLSTRITQTAGAITIEAQRAQAAEASLSVRADQIETTVSNLESDLSSQITQTAESISLSVSNLEKSVESEIGVLDGKIELRTTQGQVESMISVALDEITVTSDKIRLEGYTTINGGFAVDASGNVTIKSGSASAYMSSNGLQVSVQGSGVLRLGPTSIAMYDSSYTNTYAVAFVSGTKMTIGDGSCNVSCESVSASGNISCDTLNGYIPITRSEFTSLRERVAALETKVG